MAGDILQKTKNKERERKMKQIVEADKIIIHKIANTYVLYSKDSEQRAAISEDDVVTRLLNLGYSGKEIENMLYENSEKDSDNSVDDFNETNENLINKIATEGKSFYVDVEYDGGFNFTYSIMKSNSTSEISVMYLEKDGKYYYIIDDEDGESIDGVIYASLSFLLYNVKKLIVENVRDEIHIFENDENNVYTFCEDIKIRRN